MTSFITDLLSADASAREALPPILGRDLGRAAFPSPMPSFVESSGVVSADPLGRRSVMLRPGDWLFGRGDLRVTAMLGASVALVMWVPRYRLGAVCCYAHPQRPGGVYGLECGSGLYGEDAVRWLDERLQRSACDWSDATLSVVGGAHKQDGCAGARNLSWAQSWAHSQQIELVQQEVGGRDLRKLSFQLADGSLSITHGGRLGSADM